MEGTREARMSVRERRLLEVAVFCGVTTATLWVGGVSLVLAFWGALALLMTRAGFSGAATAAPRRVRTRTVRDTAAGGSAPPDRAAILDGDCVYVFVGQGDELTQRRVRLSRDGERLRLTPCEPQDERRPKEIRAA